MSGSSFYDDDPLKQIAINLFYGWGYNFYRHENQLRTDDLLIRSKVAGLLSIARASVETAEADYRRACIPQPSRAHPFPPPDVIANAQALERLAEEIGALGNHMHSLPVPENDLILQRIRDEAPTLQALIYRDHQLAGQAELLRSMLDCRDGAWIVSNLPAIREGLQAIRENLRARQNVLQIK